MNMFNKLKSFINSDQKQDKSEKKEEKEEKEDKEVKKKQEEDFSDNTADEIFNKIKSLEYNKNEKIISSNNINNINNCDNYEDKAVVEFEDSINLSIDKYDFSFSELNIRYSKSINVDILDNNNNHNNKYPLKDLNKVDNSNNLIISTPDIDKMKTIGKIYNNSSLSKFNEYKGKCSFSYNKNRVEGISNFPTIRSENCFFKGKWVYEITLLTNNLFQIGWVILQYNIFFNII